VAVRTTGVVGINIGKDCDREALGLQVHQAWLELATDRDTIETVVIIMSRSENAHAHALELDFDLGLAVTVTQALFVEEVFITESPPAVIQSLIKMRPFLTHEMHGMTE